MHQCVTVALRVLIKHFPPDVRRVKRLAGKFPRRCKRSLLKSVNLERRREEISRVRLFKLALREETEARPRRVRRQGRRPRRPAAKIWNQKTLGGNGKTSKTVRICRQKLAYIICVLFHRFVSRLALGR